MVAASALAATGFGAPSASAFVNGVTVSTVGDLQAASSGCLGTQVSPFTITLANDISAPSAPVSVGCHAILDLAGYDLTVRNVVINGAQALTIEDTGTGGSLTANAASAQLAGIHNTGATFTVDSGTVTATGGYLSSGIGGAGGDAVGGTTVIHGGTVTATGGDYGSGIGGGDGGSGGTTTIDGGTVTAHGGANASGIGGGSFSGADGGTTTIEGGTVTATGGELGAGIGGGFFGQGGTATIEGGTVTATGGNNAAGIGGGYLASGGTTTIDGGTVTALTGATPENASAVGAGDSGASFGTLSVEGGVLRLPSGYLRVIDADGVEVTIGADGVIDGSAGPGATYATIAGAGQIANGGRILLPTADVAGTVTISERHYTVSFDTQGGSTAPAPVTVFADSFAHGNRTIPADPTRADAVFTGWNTAADGTGDPVTSSSLLPGSSLDGTPVAVTAYAQWRQVFAVSTIGALQAASSGCDGTDASASTITLAGDITAPSAQVSIGCAAVLDLAGHHLAVRNIIVSGRQALTVQDTGTGGSVTADASGARDLAGIRNTGATLTVKSGAVTAIGGLNAAGIGGGTYGSGGTVTIFRGTVTATGGINGAGIGGGSHGSGGTVTIYNGTVTGTGGTSGAGIGGGTVGSGGGTTVFGGTVTATGGQYAAGIGGGYVGPGGTTTIEGGAVTAVVGASSGYASTVGAGDSGGSFGTLSVKGGVLRLPSGALRLLDAAGVEITIVGDGVIDGSAGPDPTYGVIAGDGQIDNGNRILLPTASFTGDVTVRQRHYAVSFDTQGGSAAPDPVTVFADSFEHGNRSFPADPTRPDGVFAGWNTAADGSGDPVTSSSTLPGSSADGAPVGVTAYAQWVLAPAITGIAPSSGSKAGGTEVVITGTGFTGASAVDFGVTGPATSYTVDSDTQITAVAPASAVSAVRHIRVTTAGGASPAVAADRFTYAASVPAVTGISPPSGGTDGGTEVIITGTGFLGATKVTFGTAGPASFTVDSDTQITATSPGPTGSGIRNIRVRTAGGTSPVVAAARFTYTAPPPAITGIAPPSGPLAGGTEVVITGTGFTGATKVVFGIAGPGTGLSVDSDTQITVSSPSSTSAATRHIRVTTPAGTSPVVTADRFTWH